MIQASVGRMIITLAILAWLGVGAIATLAGALGLMIWRRLA